MPKQIAITTTSFAKFDSKPLEILKENGFDCVLNKHGRKLDKDEVPEILKGCNGVIAGTENYSRETLTKLPKLKVISRCGTGMDAIDLKACEDLNISVLNTPDGPKQAVAELAIGLILNLLRHILIGHNDILSGKWNKKMGRLFSGKTLGIIGLGRIGQEVARLAMAFNAKIVYCDPGVHIKDKAFTSLELNDLLKQSDIVTLHLAFNDKNRNLIGKKELALMKKDALLINCSRGGIIDEQALYAVLKDKEIAGAAIDVFEQEPYSGCLKELDNVILTPHIGSYAKESRIEMEIQAANNLLKGLGANS